MAYPFAGFGSFLFTDDERGIFGTDSYWERSPSYARSRPLGSDTDTIVVTAAGSAERRFEMLLSPDRYAALQLLVGTIASFTDWERPVPDSRQALLASLDHRARVFALCSDGETRWRVRVGVLLVSQ